jgi:hypothetical protein
MAVSSQQPTTKRLFVQSAQLSRRLSLYKWLLCYHAALRAAASSCHNLHPGNPQTCQTAENVCERDQGDPYSQLRPRTLALWRAPI